MLQTALGSALVARQYGILLAADSIEEDFASGEIRDRDSFIRFFDKHGVLTRFKRVKGKDLETRGYIFPCVAPLQDGGALVLAGMAPREEGEAPAIATIDPADPSGKVEVIPLDDLQARWTGQVVLVTRRSGQRSMDRPFDWDWFIPELHRYKWLLILTLLVSLILHALSFTPIIFIQIALDKVIGYKATSTLAVLTGGVLLALMFNGLLGYVREYLVRFVSAAIEARLSGDAFDKLLAMPVHMFQGQDATSIEEGIQGAGTLRGFLARKVLGGLFDLTSLLVFLPILFAYSIPMALLVIGFAVVMGGASLAFKGVEKGRARAAGQKEHVKNVVLRETVAGIDTVKTLSQETTQRRAWRQAAAVAIRAQGDREKISAMSNQVNSVLQQAMTVAIIFVGIQLVFGGLMSAGALIAVNMMGSRVVRPIVQAISGIAELDRVKAAMEQLGMIWNSQPERAGFGVQKTIQGRYELVHASVEFGEHVKALDNITLTIPERRKIAVVGPAGSGKSTLLRVLQGLTRPTSGTFEVDGTPFANLDLEQFRKQVALVTSRPSFFTGTIEENLRRVRPNVSKRELEEALRLSGLSDALPRIPHGLAAQIDERASTLPNAFRQILAIARALVSDPNVLLLDEVFAVLDKTQQLVLHLNLDEIAANRTLILVSQDIDLIDDFHRIIVLDDGNLAGDGTHEQLLNSCATYKEMWMIERELTWREHKMS
ncbi:peptidase domain-containing ABC transporter [Magnetospira sp. QH-2]|uniref:peptidase domain-containing ABC transporter n=1 Tax=Magnetospira sp. (strain QH-2) TaxID=1288970 RepID=UPI0003E81891|nr:peptidase domain-containing ABC transporter [Magnetospira sp. QH-2]CCQ75146.1 putative ABC transporter related protein [Magnetospira sp. QH-2]